MSRYQFAAAGMLVVASLTAGCGRRLPKLVQVTGTVRLDGKPTEGLLVNFTPAEGRGAAAVTDPDGKYRLLYLGDAPGIEPGKYRVTINWAKENRVPALPVRYHAKSDVSIDIAADLQRDFDLDGKGPAAANDSGEER